MEDDTLRLEALTLAIQLAPNNDTGNSTVVVEDAQKFYAFLSGQNTIPDPLPGHVYRLVPENE